MDAVANIIAEAEFIPIKPDCYKMDRFHPIQDGDPMYYLDKYQDHPGLSCCSSAIEAYKLIKDDPKMMALLYLSSLIYRPVEVTVSR